MFFGMDRLAMEGLSALVGWETNICKAAVAMLCLICLAIDDSVRSFHWCLPHPVEPLGTREGLVPLRL
jgi:hypothetical protein